MMKYQAKALMAGLMLSVLALTACGGGDAITDKTTTETTVATTSDENNVFRHATPEEVDKKAGMEARNDIGVANMNLIVNEAILNPNVKVTNHGVKVSNEGAKVQYDVALREATHLTQELNGNIFIMEDKSGISITVENKEYLTSNDYWFNLLAGNSQFFHDYKSSSDRVAGQGYFLVSVIATNSNKTERMGCAYDYSFNVTVKPDEKPSIHLDYLDNITNFKCSIVDDDEVSTN